MARHLRSALAQVKLRCRTHLPVDVDELAVRAGHQWRDRKLTPCVTIWLFILQVLHGNTAMTNLRHLSGLAIEAASYCAARARLPVELFAGLFDAMNAAAGMPHHLCCTLLHGRRVLLADGTSFSMPDTPELAAHFGYPPGQLSTRAGSTGGALGEIDPLSPLNPASLLGLGVSTLMRPRR